MNYQIYVWMRVFCISVFPHLFHCCSRKGRPLRVFCDAPSTDSPVFTRHFEGMLSPDFRFHVGTADSKGNPVYNEVILVRNEVHLSYPYGRVRRSVAKKRKLLRMLNRTRIPFGHDYIDIGRVNLSTMGAQRSGQTDRGPYLVELLVVVDKAWADIFKQDHCSILNYLVAYMSMVNTYYKTLPSVDISFRLNGIVVMQNSAAQPFLQHVEADPLALALDPFAMWLGKQQDWIVPYDLASLIQNRIPDVKLGLAMLGAACFPAGVGTWYDEGKFGRRVTEGDYGSFDGPGVAAHELGHNLGADHDGGSCGGGYLMAPAANGAKSFSSCSDQQITNFVTSKFASCLREKNG